MPEHLPWHTDKLQRQAELLHGKRLPHALLLAGPTGLGKLDFAELLAELVLCERANDGLTEPCGECASCGLLAAGTHPDLRLITLVESKQLKIEQIRGLIDWAMQTSARGGNRIAIIHPADAMNLAAANALLKLLEEPPANTYLLLVTDQMVRLLPTIRSRCQVLEFVAPPMDTSIDWLTGQGLALDEAQLRLQLSSGAPLTARDQYDDDWRDRRKKLLKTIAELVNGKTQALPAASALMSKEYPAEIYQTLYTLLADAARIQFDQNIRNIDAETLVQRLAERYDRSQLIKLTDVVANAERLTKSVNNPNQQLLLESVLIEITV